MDNMSEFQMQNPLQAPMQDPMMYPYQRPMANQENQYQQPMANVSEPNRQQVLQPETQTEQPTETQKCDTGSSSHYGRDQEQPSSEGTLEESWIGTKGFTCP